MLLPNHAASHAHSNRVLMADTGLGCDQLSAGAIGHFIGKTWKTHGMAVDL